MQARPPAPPPASQHPAHTRKSQEVTPPPRWETVPAEHRRYLGQVLARGIIRHSLLTIKEVPEDCASSPTMSTQGRWIDTPGPSSAAPGDGVCAPIPSATSRRACGVHGPAIGAGGSGHRLWMVTCTGHRPRRGARPKRPEHGHALGLPASVSRGQLRPRRVDAGAGAQAIGTRQEGRAPTACTLCHFWDRVGRCRWPV